MSHQVEIKVSILAQHLGALGQFLGSLDGAVAQTETAEKPEVKVTTTPAATETKPRRTRASADKPEPTKAEPTEPTKAEPTEDEVPADYYDKTVKPELVKLSSHKNGGREAAIGIVTQFGVKNAKDIPADQLAEVLKLAKAKLAELDKAEPEEDDEDVSFE